MLEMWDGENIQVSFIQGFPGVSRPCSMLSHSGTGPFSKLESSLTFEGSFFWCFFISGPGTSPVKALQWEGNEKEGKNPLFK